MVGRVIAEAMTANPDLRVVVVVPRYPDHDDTATRIPALLGAAPRHERHRRGGRRPVRRLRHRERRGNADLRARQGRHRRRRLGDDRLGQPEPALLDPRQRAVDRRPRRDARRTRPAGPGRASGTARASSPAISGSSCGASTSAAAPTTSDDLLDPDEAFAAFARQAKDLEDWDASGRAGPRPPGRVMQTPSRGHQRPSSVGGLRRSTDSCTTRTVARCAIACARRP